MPCPYGPGWIDKVQQKSVWWTFPVHSSEIHQAAYAVMTIQGSKVASIHVKRKDLGVTVNDLMLAAVADETVQQFFDRINQLLPGYTGPGNDGLLHVIP